MQALVVLAHPLSDGLCAHLAHEAIDALRARGATVDILDLYAEQFQPALTEAERRLHYTTPEPGPEIVALQARLAAADTLVLVFPTWWFSLPAILKGGSTASGHRNSLSNTAPRSSRCSPVSSRASW